MQPCHPESICSEVKAPQYPEECMWPQSQDQTSKQKVLCNVSPGAFRMHEKRTKALTKMMIGQSRLTQNFDSHQVRSRVRRQIE